MIPKTIQPYFEIMNQTKDGGNDIIEGVLTCCGSHEFEVLVAGEIKHSAFSKMYLCSDGYDKCGEKQHTHMQMKPVKCKKCQNGGFSVSIKYEYPDIQELKELEIPEIDNAFTWIWITLGCNKCGTRYKNFVDCETA